jgi:hypothetical protein
VIKSGDVHFGNVLIIGRGQISGYLSSRHDFSVVGFREFLVGGWPKSEKGPYKVVVLGKATQNFQSLLFIFRLLEGFRSGLVGSILFFHTQQSLSSMMIGDVIAKRFLFDSYAVRKNFEMICIKMLSNRYGVPCCIAYIPFFLVKHSFPKRYFKEVNPVDCKQGDLLHLGLSVSGLINNVESYFSREAEGEKVCFWFDSVFVVEKRFFSGQRFQLRGFKNLLLISNLFVVASVLKGFVASGKTGSNDAADILLERETFTDFDRSFFHTGFDGRFVNRLIRDDGELGGFHED